MAYHRTTEKLTKWLPSFIRRLFTLLCLTPVLSQADWPTYQNDASRSGFTETKLPQHLSLSWSHKATQPPLPAWPRQDRMTFDRAYHPVLGDGLLFWGSSADDAVHALDAKTGEEKWTFFTEGPIRFAPALAQGKLYVVSDDGYLYCLHPPDGRLIWKKLGGIDDHRIIGNQRMISRAPARGSPVLVCDRIYFAAGIWPSDGMYLHALDAETGASVWLNDSAGSIYMGQPHGGAFAESGVSAQGYLVADDKRLYVPTGRAVPAVFDRATGVFQYFHLQRHGQIGGSTLMAARDSFLHNGLMFNGSDGSVGLKIESGPVAATRDGFVCATRKAIAPYRWDDLKGLKSKRLTKGYTNIVNGATAYSLVVAGNRLVMGAAGKISTVDLKTGRAGWSAEVEGTVYALAVSDERLYAGTDRGYLYCFDEKDAPSKTIQPQPDVLPYGPNRTFAKAATEILETTGVKRGYALDIGCGDGRLAYELTKRSELMIIGVESDKEKVDLARRRLAAAGVYGRRVTILHGDPDSIKLPDYFANLIVSTRAMAETAKNTRRDLLRPYGGVLCLGQSGNWSVTRRGPLEGAGQWTHQYANPANTVCSDDAIVRGPLGMLWFGDLGQPMVQRHGRAPAPLFYNGVIYSEGRDSLIAVDAYNGHKLWEYALPGILKAYDGDHLMGTSGTGSNYCVDDGKVFVRRGSECLQIDAQSGALLNTFTAPTGADDKPGAWGYLAASRGMLYGTLADTSHVVTYRYRNSGNMKGQLTQSTALFALDANTGDLKWRYDATYSLRHNAIAISSNCVLLVDKPSDLADRKRGEKSVPEERGDLVALDARTGITKWANNQDIYGTVLAASDRHQVVMMSYQPTRFKLASELGGRISVFDLETGKRRWEKKASYDSRPLINDRTIYTQGGAWDLLNGESRPFNFKRSYGCGVLAGAKDLMVFRSATLGYFDLTRNERNEDFGGIRPGCWINVIPAGGLVLAPDASAGCKCSYLNQSWIALRPFGLREPTIRPDRRTSRQPIKISFKPDRPGKETIRYTLDGSTPDLSSPRFTESFLLRETAVVKARAFDDDGTASPVEEAEYIVNPAMLPLETDRWTTVDAPGSKPPSVWDAADGSIHQKSNVMVGGDEVMRPDPQIERPGSMRIYNDGQSFRDGTFSFEISSKDNDGVGVAFRVASKNQYYLWAVNSERKYRTLSVKDGESFKTLAVNNRGYVPGQTYQVRIELAGRRIQVFVDGKKDMEVEDATFTEGTVALYSWGNTGVRFGRVLFEEKD